MYQQFTLICLEHRPEQQASGGPLRLSETLCRRLLHVLRHELGLADVLVLSGRRRTEIYYSSPEDRADAVVAALGHIRSTEAAFATPEYTRTLYTADAAVQHLLEVALGQAAAYTTTSMQDYDCLRQAYQWAADEDTAGPFLHRLLHTAFFAHKRLAEDSLPSRPSATLLVAECLADLRAWSAEMQISPALKQLESALEQLRQEELRRHGKKLSATERALMEELTQALLRNVLAKPSQRLGAACQRGQPNSLVEALALLFNLEAVPAA